MSSDQLVEKLQAFAKAKKPVEIIYHGGSQPGSKRELVPIKVTNREMRAREVLTGLSKNFLIAKVELPGEAEEIPSYRLDFPDPRDVIGTIGELLRDHVKPLEALGWHVTLEDNSMDLRIHFKNGKLRKTPVCGIHKYDEEANDFGDAVSTMPNSRPFSVWSQEMASSRNFTFVGHAVELFIQQAYDTAPVQKK